jgi:hypothetical protein
MVYGMADANASSCNRFTLGYIVPLASESFKKCFRLNPTLLPNS